MTVLAAPSPAETLLADLAPESGLALRRWSSEEFRRLVSSAVLSDAENLDLVGGEIVACGSRVPYLFNRDEYYNLAEQGILRSEERTELIYGRIITRMSPMGRRHSVAVSKTATALAAAFGEGYAVEQQMSMQMGSGLEPQPDVMVLPGAFDDYKDAPRASDVRLLVEISDSTLRYDRGTKAALYAAEAVPDYWLLNLKARTLEVRREPESGEYLTLKVYSEEEAIAPLAVPNSPIRVADLLPFAPPQPR